MKNRTMKHAILDDDLAKYWKANKKDKGLILDKKENATGMPRKSIIRYMNRKQKDTSSSLSSLPNQSSRKGINRAGRPKKYSADVDAALAYVWEIYNSPAAERLHTILKEAVRILRRDKMWSFGRETTDSLLEMSLGSMKLRTVAMAKKRHLMRGLSSTKPSGIKLAVPIFKGDWSLQGLGHGQIDTVVHSGPKLMGRMAYTINFVDAKTYWQEPIAQLDKSERATTESLKLLQKHLPFPLLGLHPDTGKEFINWTAKKWCDHEGIELSRSRPSKSNDNCFIEQRNNVVVRKYLGYERYDCSEAVEIMNQLYEQLRLYLNFFQTTFKLIGKVRRVDNTGRNLRGYRRIYDKPATPFHRLLQEKAVSEEIKERLRIQYETLNPKLLLDTIKVLTIKLERTQRELGYHY